MALEKSRLVLSIRERIWANARPSAQRWIFPEATIQEKGYIAEDLRICPPSSRGHAAFAAFLWQDGEYRYGSWTRVPLFRAPQASAAYKYPVN